MNSLKGVLHTTCTQNFNAQTCLMSIFNSLSFENQACALLFGRMLPLGGRKVRCKSICCQKFKQKQKTRRLRGVDFTHFKIVAVVTVVPDDRERQSFGKLGCDCSLSPKIHWLATVLKAIFSNFLVQHRNHQRDKWFKAWQKSGYPQK